MTLRGALLRLLLLLLIFSVEGTPGVCSLTQTCIQIGVDSDCLPVLSNQTINEDGTWSNRSFPMDASHGFMAEGFGSSPIVCPQYTNNSCCTWQQNEALYANFITLVSTFGVNKDGGCLACAYNLVNWWCGMICSPDQSEFTKAHDPVRAVRLDDLTGEMSEVQQMDVSLQSDYVCDLYESCKNTAIASQASAMQSALGFLNYQAQTGATGHGEYFFLNFDNSTQSKAFSYPNLKCDAYVYPGTDTIPFPYPLPGPDPSNALESCGCGACASACSTGGSLDIQIVENPIGATWGFDVLTVSCVYGAVAVICTIYLHFYGKTSEKNE